MSRIMALTLRVVGAVLLVLVIVITGATFWLQWPRTGPAPSDMAQAGSGELTLQWFGVSSVLLRAGDSAIMIDPFFTRRPGKLGLLTNRAQPPDETEIRHWLDRAGVERLDAVVVSHAHYDHAMDAGVVARMTEAKLLGSRNVAMIGRGAGVPEARIRIVSAGDTLSAGDFRMRFHRSRHAGATGGRPRGKITQPLIAPASPLAYRQDATWSIAIAYEDTKLLHHGSAGYEPGALDAVKADVVLLGIALIEDLPEYLEAVVETVGARRVFAVHWDDFTRPLSKPLQPLPFGVNVPEFLETARQRYPDIDFAVMPLAQPVPIAAADPARERR